jgi:aminopeptidase N
MRYLPLLLLLAAPVAAQAPTAKVYGHADSLRGGIDSPGRNWWDVTFYDLHVAISPVDSTIRGWNAITYKVTGAGRELQIDLMTPLEVDSMVQGGRKLSFRRDGNAFFATPAASRVGETATVTVYYHGAPQPAVNPPWSGGFSWKVDSLGRAWVVTTDQGVGASIWWPNKDTQADEPDSQRTALTVPAGLTNVSNGRLRSTSKNPDGTTTWEWFVTNPINNYAIAVATGNYAHYSDSYTGERGTLSIDYWPLDYHLEAAQRQWPQVKPMLACFERWFGPYPWYEDGYKLVEVSNNGMEHQSAVAYGNRFANGYQGRDGSGTGLGMKWDFIIIHESAHEWWGNNITTKDLRDMWVHESFANYSENIYTECLFGKDSGAAYAVGTRRGIRNDRPIVPPEMGVNAQGSGDMYPKGGNMLHTIRQIVNDDEKWRGILRGLNQTFWHKTVTGEEIQRYISTQAGIDLSRVFQQYLTDVRIPVFEYRSLAGKTEYRWSEVVPGFDMPVRVSIGGTVRTLKPTTSWQTLEGATGPVVVDVNYYVVGRAVER